MIFFICAMSVFFLHYLVFLSVDFLGIFKINLNCFRNIRLHLFFYFSYFLYCGTKYLSVKLPVATVILLQHISDDRHINNTWYCRYSIVLSTKSALKHNIFYKYTSVLYLIRWGMMQQTH